MFEYSGFNYHAQPIIVCLAIKLLLTTADLWIFDFFKFINCSMALYAPWKSRKWQKSRISESFLRFFWFFGRLPPLKHVFSRLPPEIFSTLHPCGLKQNCFQQQNISHNSKIQQKKSLPVSCKNMSSEGPSGRAKSVSSKLSGVMRTRWSDRLSDILWSEKKQCNSVEKCKQHWKPEKRNFLKTVCPRWWWSGMFCIDFDCQEIIFLIV